MIEATKVERPTAVVLGATGGIGRLVGGVLVEVGADVIGVDRLPADEPAVARHIVLDVNDGDGVADVLRPADIVVTALPRTLVPRVLDTVETMRDRRRLLVETSSVKGDLAVRLHRAAAANESLEVLSVMPAFGPGLGADGGRVMVIPVRSGELAGFFCDAWRTRGATLDEVTAEQHDLLLARTQAAAHFALLAFGESLRRSPIPVAQLAAFGTPPFQVMLRLLARMLDLGPHVVGEIQHDNEFADAAREDHIAAARRIADDVASSACPEELLASLTTLLGASRRPLEEDAAEIFALVRHQERRHR
ncbi:MAG: hypothetical protein AAFY28_11750 [Actinomycetota bacterium]